MVRQDSEESFTERLQSRNVFRTSSKGSNLIPDEMCRILWDVLDERRDSKGALPQNGRDPQPHLKVVLVILSV